MLKTGSLTSRPHGTPKQILIIGKAEAVRQGTIIFSLAYYLEIKSMCLKCFGEENILLPISVPYSQPSFLATNDLSRQGLRHLKKKKKKKRYSWRLYS
jgi:hypothetical protein